VNHDQSAQRSFGDIPDFSQTAQGFGHQIRPMINVVGGHSKHKVCNGTARNLHG
jgi:hypothetical protein